MSSFEHEFLRPTVAARSPAEAQSLDAADGRYCQGFSSGWEQDPPLPPCPKTLAPREVQPSSWGASTKLPNLGSSLPIMSHAFIGAQLGGGSASPPHPAIFFLLLALKRPWQRLSLLRGLSGNPMIALGKAACLLPMFSIFFSRKSAPERHLKTHCCFFLGGGRMGSKSTHKSYHTFIILEMPCSCRSISEPLERDLFWEGAERVIFSVKIHTQGAQRTQRNPHLFPVWVLLNQLFLVVLLNPFSLLVWQPWQCMLLILSYSTNINYFLVLVFFLLIKQSRFYQINFYFDLVSIFFGIMLCLHRVFCFFYSIFWLFPPLISTPVLRCFTYFYLL